MSSQLLNIIGLVLDIFGVIGLFRFGLPPLVFLNHVKAKESYPSKKESVYAKYSKIALSLIIIGFLFQIASNVVSYSSNKLDSNNQAIILNNRGIEKKNDNIILNTPKKEISQFLLTETHLESLNLNNLIDHNIANEIKSSFPDLQLTKTREQQDGPDFNLYEITNSDSEFFFISMDSYDSMLVQDIWTKNPKIKDEYGLFVGAPIDSTLTKRPDINFYSDLHYNIYASAKNSKIQYRLNGQFKSLNDSFIVAEDYSVEKWQIEGMKIECLIWKK